VYRTGAENTWSLTKGAGLRGQTTSRSIMGYWVYRDVTESKCACIWMAKQIPSRVKTKRLWKNIHRFRKSWSQFNCSVWERNTRTHVM